MRPPPGWCCGRRRHTAIGFKVRVLHSDEALPDSVVLVAVAAGVQSCRPQLSALSQLLRNAAVQSPDLHPRAGGGDF